MTTVTRIGKAHWIDRGERIESARGFVGYTLEQVAEKMTQALGYKISRQIVHTLEKGKRDWRGDERMALAYVLGQTAEWLDCTPEAAFNEDAKILVLALHPMGLTTHKTLLAAA